MSLLISFSGGFQHSGRRRRRDTGREAQRDGRNKSQNGNNLNNTQMYLKDAIQVKVIENRDEEVTGVCILVVTII